MCVRMPLIGTVFEISGAVGMIIMATSVFRMLLERVEGNERNGKRESAGYHHGRDAE